MLSRLFAHALQAGAKLTATQVMEDFGIAPPPLGPSTMTSTAAPYGTRKNAHSKLDVLQPLLFWDIERYVAAGLMAIAAVVLFRLANLAIAHNLF